MHTLYYFNKVIRTVPTQRFIFAHESSTFLHVYVSRVCDTDGWLSRVDKRALSDCCPAKTSHHWVRFLTWIECTFIIFKLSFITINYNSLRNPTINKLSNYRFYTKTKIIFCLFFPNITINSHKLNSDNRTAWR